MYPRGFSAELWTELMWSFVWILMIPATMTLILLTLTAVAGVVGRAVQRPRRRNKVSNTSLATAPARSKS